MRNNQKRCKHFSNEQTNLCVNRSSIDLLTKQNLSHYQMLNQIEAKFREWSPATFLGYSSINFDDEVIRKEFFKTLREPYITNTKGNVRHDALNIVRAAFAINPEVLKTELNAKGNISMKLESLGRMNGYDTDAAHSALFDASLTMKILGLIKKKQPHTWDIFLKTASTGGLIFSNSTVTFKTFFSFRIFLAILAVGTSIIFDRINICSLTILITFT